MGNKIASKRNVVFELPEYGLTILSDPFANLFWKHADAEVMPLAELPWELQLPFFLKFLHDDRLAERFKDCEILGAIDIYIKSKYFLREELNLED